MAWIRLSRFIKRLQTKGLRDTLAMIVFRYTAPVIRIFFRRRAVKQIRALLSQGQRVFVIKSTLDYDFPYCQRPHHLAHALAKSGALVLFVTPGAGYDKVTTIVQCAPNLYVTPHFEVPIESCPNSALIIFSTDVNVHLAQLNKVWRKGVVIYDYIDALDDVVSNGRLTDKRRKLHRLLLQRERDTICLASAASLFEEVASHRNSNYALVENGVDVAHFSVFRSRESIDKSLRQIVDEGRPIAGYFGALAEWLDYDLLLAVSYLQPDVNFVLMGLNYDRSVEALNAAPTNVYVLPPIKYDALPWSAVWFDVALLPFKLNHITKATSPLKLFEYMALGLPVVATPIPEVAKYKSVAQAATPEDFSIRISELLHKVDPARRKCVLAEAAENDWLRRAQLINTAINSYDSDRLISRRMGTHRHPESEWPVIIEAVHNSTI